MSKTRTGTLKKKRSSSSCAICNRTTSTQFLQCDTCDKWWCDNCINAETSGTISSALFDKLQLMTDFHWDCANCVNMTLPEQLINSGVFTKEELQDLQVTMTSISCQETQSGENNVKSTTNSSGSCNFPSSSQLTDGNAMATMMMQMMIEMRRDNREREEREERRRREDKEREEQHRREDREHQERMYTLLVEKLTSTKTENIENSSNPTEQPSSKLQVNLPKFQIPNFHGQIAEWTEFWQTFKVAVHDNKDLPIQAKFEYLSAHLKDEAAATIKGLAKTPENYEHALEILKSQFGNKTKIKEHHIRSILNLHIVKDDLSNLSEFFQKLEVNLKSLETLGLGEVMGEILLVPLKEKLPSKLTSEFYKNQRSKGIEDHTLSHFRIFLTNYIKDSSLGEKKSSTMEQRPYYSAKPTAAALVGPSSAASQFNCAFCQAAKGSHWSSSCPVITDPKQRAEKLKERSLCMRCLFPRDHRVCPAINKECRICKKPGHHHAVCFKNEPKKSTPTLHLVQNEKRKSTDTNTKDFLMIVEGKIRNANDSTKSTLVNIFLDTGSQHSFIRSELADQLQLASESRKTKGSISVGRFGSSDVKEIPKVRVPFQLQKMDGNYLALSALKVPFITAPLFGGPLKLSSEVLTALDGKQVSNLQFYDEKKFCIDVLIGIDCFNKICSESKILTDSVSLFKSCLGNLLLGHVGQLDSSQSSHIVIAPALLSTSIETLSEDKVEQFWKLESIGIKDDPVISDDDNAMNQFTETVQKIEGRYHVSWPWRNQGVNLPSNFHLARERLRRFHRTKLLPNPNLLKKYHTVMTDQLKQGIIERVPQNEVFQSKYLVHYIPHHGVMKESSNTTKLRVVYDASAKTSSGSSLNQHLLRGPVFLADLIGLLLRFRLQRYVSVSDIEKAFLQVGLNTPDRDVTRFLWLKDPTLPLTPENMDVFRFCRVPFGFISSPFLLAATLNYHLERLDNPIAATIQMNTYVDNIFLGAETEEEMFIIYKKAKDIFSQAKMNLREWSINSEQLMCLIPEQDRGSEDNVKVLGMVWDLKQDNMFIKGGDFSTTVCTKRTLLKTMASVFDPLGLMAPLLLPAKLLFQSLWKTKIEWDTPLNEDQQTQYKSAITSLARTHDFQIPRYLLANTSDKTVELLCFTDASEKAYGTCIYIKQEKHIQLVFSKSRLAPLNSPSIPRLELLGVLVGVRMLKFIKKQLESSIQVKNLHLWSDSQVVLNWISSSHQRTVFVQNRLSEIWQSPEIIFHYAESKDNPADMTTKTVTVAQMTSFWWEGPAWLSDTAHPGWSVWQPKEDNLELRHKDTPALVTTEERMQESPPAGIQADRFSSLSQLLRVTALVLRFTRNCTKSQESIKETHGVINPNEIQEARLLWVRHCQRSTLPAIFKTPTELRQTDMVKGLKLYLDQENIIRSAGRLQNSNISFDANNPVLLPKNHHYTLLTIQNIHQNLLHAGTEQTLNKLRQQYWIPNGRTQVRGALRQCLQCRKAEGHSFRPPAMPPLPAARVLPSPAFTHIGLDLMGPLYLKNRRLVYIYLFVCMSTRAVHLELVDHKNTDSFLEAFSRFCSRRGTPSEILSDNATQFRMARNIILSASEKIKSSVVLHSLLVNPPKWSFIPPAAPWVGGFYERIVGIIKRSLRKNLGKTSLKRSQLETLIIAIEAVINTRPLTYIGSNIQDGWTLTPAHFIAPATRLLPTPFLYQAANCQPTSTDLLNLWKKGQRLLKSFWDSWENEYLPQLRTKSLQPSKSYQQSVNRKPEVGEIVLIHEDRIPRIYWNLGQIAELHLSKDGKCRSCKIQTSNGNFIRRPVQKIYPLEIEPKYLSGGECRVAN